MRISIPPQVQSILDSLNDAGFPAYVVGGCVRDCLMGRPPHDWDVTTGAAPEQMRTALASFPLFETGAKHGTLTAMAEEMPVEVTAFRVDGSYSDHRRPDSVAFTDDLLADLRRRDFTMNAMAYRPGSSLVDAFGGRADIENKTIRCVGDADARFQEDALRILRALRFASTFRFRIETNTAEAILRNRELLRKLAVERVNTELSRLLCGEDAASILAQFAPVFFTLIPVLEKTQGFAQQTPYHIYDVWQHTLKTVAAAPAMPELRMAMLLHDLAKPDCLTVDANGRAHFHGHAERGAEQAEQILRELRYPKVFCARVVTLIRHHVLRLSQHPDRLPHWLGKLGPECFFQLLAVMRADVMGKAPGCQTELEALDRIQERAEALLAKKACLGLADLAVTGHDLAAAGISTGPEIGKQLRRLLDAVLSGDVENEKDALLSYLQ